MSSLNRFVVPGLGVIILLVSSVIPAHSASGSRAPNLAGAWVVQSTCIPRCFADPHRTLDTATNQVRLGLVRGGKFPVYASQGKSVGNHVHVVFVGAGVAMLHTRVCSVRLQVPPATGRMTGSGILVRKFNSQWFVATLVMSWIRAPLVPPAPPASRNLTDQLLPSDPRLPVDC